jgi:hypothetical protein
MSKQLLAHDDTPFPRQLFFFTRCTDADFGHVRMLIKGYINQMSGERPSDLRMWVPVPTTNLAGMEVTLAETHCRVTINGPYRSWQDARKLEGGLEMQPQHFIMLGIINLDS